MSIISDVFAGGAEGILKGVKDVVSTFKADPLELAKLQAELSKVETTFTLGMAQAQTKINEIEAASQDKFVSRWRPAVGWVCVSAYAYTFVLQPFMAFIIVAAGVHSDLNQLPKLDMGELSMLLAGLLGIGTMRSVDKYFNNK